MVRRMIVYTLILGVVISIAGALLLVRTQTMPPTHSPLIFDDGFDGADLDRSKWGTCYPWFKTTGCTNHGNPELEWYLPEQVSVQGGVLHRAQVHSSVLLRPVSVGGKDGSGVEALDSDVHSPLS